MERRVVDARPAGAGLGCCRRGCGAVRRRNPVSRGGQGGGGRTRQDAVRASSQRQPKDPRDFGGDIEKMRDHLHNEASGGSGFISGMLNGISQAAFGRGKRGNGVFGALGSFYRQVISGLSIETPKGSSNSVLIFPPPPEDPLWIHATEVENFWRENGRGKEPATSRAVNATLGLYKELQQDPTFAGTLSTPVDLAARMETLSSVLVCQPTDTAVMCKRIPSVLCRDPGTVLRQMLVLKTILPGADVSRMLQLRPQILAEEQLEEVIRPQLKLLRTYLPGVNIDELVQEHPYIVFEEVESGLKQLRDLWPADMVDDSTLGGSQHHELVLAIRALSNSGAPKKWSAGGME